MQLDLTNWKSEKQRHELRQAAAKQQSQERKRLKREAHLEMLALAAAAEKKIKKAGHSLTVQQILKHLAMEQGRQETFAERAKRWSIQANDGRLH